METVSSNSSSTKKRKNSEDALALDPPVPTTASNPDSMNSAPLDQPNDSEPESEDSDNLSDASSYYDYDEDFSYDETLSLQAQFDATNLPPGVEASIPWLELPDNNQKLTVTTSNSTIQSQLSSFWEKEKAVDEEEDQVLKNYRQFKIFDTVQGFLDHHYCKGSSTSSQASRDWSKTIQNEWRILEMNLPDTIFVRVYEERMDLLRAVIIGAAGTPYHDGLFFFDVFFPFDYPKVPPQVYYHSGGLRLNPNLYSSGKVCLSLLNTWQGSTVEKWTPGKSTMLQVLLSIQALVLNAKPYFNEPGYEFTAGQKTGEKKAKDYNENTFILSCKTMLYTLQRPPKHFEDFVAGHFRVRAQAIMEACREYIKGALVGSDIGGEVQKAINDGNSSSGAQVGSVIGGEVPKAINDDNSSSLNFRKSLGIVVGSLVPALIKNGAEDCEKFIPLGDVDRSTPLKL